MAKANGASVPEAVVAKLEENARAKYSPESKGFTDSAAAGVQLYSYAANLGVMQQGVNTREIREQQLQMELSAASTPVDKERIQSQIRGLEENEKACDAATEAVVARVNDPAFVSGFGSNGGEEFLSYMQIGESLLAKGGEPWEKWDAAMTGNLTRIQNADGSFSGHHCITGRTFCTATALMVLMSDRSTAPTSQALAKR
jgi:hypothetical protein